MSRELSPTKREISVTKLPRMFIQCFRVCVTVIYDCQRSPLPYSRAIRYSEQHSIPRNLSSKTSTCSKLHQLNLTVQNRYKTSVTRQSTTVGSAWFKHLWGNKISSFCGALVFLTHRPPLKRSGVKQKSGGFFYSYI